MGRQPSCLTCARLLHSILFQRPIRCDYEMDYPRASRSSTRGSQARGTRLMEFEHKLAPVRQTPYKPTCKHHKLP